jgi:glycosyltransferase involved in cell wall biosynthesis
LATHPVRCAAALATAWRLARPGVRGRLWSCFYFLEAVVVWDRCRRVGARHLHVHHLNQAGDVAMVAVELEGRPRGRASWTWSFTMHGPDELTDVTRFRLADKARHASAVACISDYARSQLMALLPPDQWAKLRVVHCGLVPDEWSMGRHEPSPPGAIRVLYVGRMVPVKGQPVLFEAIEELVQQRVDVRATFVGDGPSMDDLRQRVAAAGLSERIELTGAVGQDDIKQHFAAADVLVVPSFAEGVPVVLMEAMAAGLPVVASHIAGIPELVDDGISGILVPPGRSDALADALRRLADDPELREAMGRRGRAKVEAEFDVRQSATDLEAMFAQLVAR